MPGMCNQGFVFCEKVKEKLGSSDDYQTFLKCLDIYSSGIIKRNDLQTLVCLVYFCNYSVLWKSCGAQSHSRCHSFFGWGWGGGGDWKCLIGLINTYVKHNLIQHVIVSLFYMSFLFPVSVLGFAGQSVYMVLLGSSD